MKILLGALVVCVAVLGLFEFKQAKQIEQQSAALAGLRQQVEASKRNDDLATQEKCAAQSAKLFDQLGWNHPDKGSIPSYRNHYNAGIGRCFMLIEVYAYPMTTKMLLDAYEQREYADYAWRADPQKKYSEVPPMMCKLMPANEAEITCGSSEEFDAFVAKYLD